MPRKGEVIDMTGKVFGLLTVLREDGRSSTGEAMWLCRCQCGNVKRMWGRSLRRGEAKSCGCRQHMGRYSHGECVGGMTPLYYVWAHMISDERHKGAPVCPEWHDAATFFEWARRRGYRKGMFFSRINTQAGWYPENAMFSVKRNPCRPKNTKIKPIPKPDKTGRRKPQ